MKKLLLGVGLGLSFLTASICKADCYDDYGRCIDELTATCLVVPILCASQMGKCSNQLNKCITENCDVNGRDYCGTTQPIP